MTGQTRIDPKSTEENGIHRDAIVNDNLRAFVSLPMHYDGIDGKERILMLRMLIRKRKEKILTTLSSCKALF